jgi:hypothetical protein
MFLKHVVPRNTKQVLALVGMRIRLDVEMGVFGV